MKTVSMLAATTCSSVSSPATLRENRLRRGNTASMVAVASPADGRAATQSPTADNCSLLSASWSSRPECCACSSPASA